MFEHFIESALIIDDKEEEIIELKKLLESRDILVRHLLPENLKNEEGILKNRKILFLDLYVEEDKNLTSNISILRGIFQKRLGKNFGTYGIVLWSKHVDEIKEFKSKIANDAALYTLPLFVVGVEKNKYLQANNYDTLLADINETLKQNLAASFFIYWDKLVKTGKDNVIESIYSMIKDYEKQDTDLRFILQKLAQNCTGVPDAKLSDYRLEPDAIKALSDMLSYEITNADSSKLSLFSMPPVDKFSGSDEDKKIIYADLNSKLLLDSVNVNQKVVVPGNVYKIIDGDSFFALKDTPANSTKIIIEVTPPCDFAVDKKAKRSRVLGGFYCKNDLSSSAISNLSKENFYKELNSLKILGESELQLLRFDFRYFGSVDEDDLKDENKYKIIFKTKDKLFADILQKLSSHTARLGLPVIR